MKAFLKSLLIAVILIPHGLWAQEYTAPISHTSRLSESTAAKPTALSLPFFEDFTLNSIFPDPALWEQQGVYISNTMPIGIFSRGCAIFDADDAQGIPYDSVNAYIQSSADTMSSQAIDLSSYTPADSLWLSFYYEPKGLGFYPKPDDSLLLFFLQSDGLWRQVWATSGDTALHFQQVMVPVLDTSFFHDHFQLRFRNKATHGISNSEWMLDYVLLDANRDFTDTFVKDVAFSKEPGNLLNDFSAMPYRHFKTAPQDFLASHIEAHLKNNGNTAATLNFGYQAKELLTGTDFGSATASDFFNANEEKSISFPMFNFSTFQPPVASEGQVRIQSKYFATGIYAGEPKENDTILQTQEFDNYFAYDDGSAEQSYFLHLYPSAPGSIAIEYALYEPDTIRGVNINFPRTVPSSAQKEFSLAVYQDIAVNGGSDQLVYQQDFLNPQYPDTVNEFTTYVFDEPVVLPAGVFYIRIIQSAGGFSDSLYIGIDKNRIGGNHRYINLDGSWASSLIDGALLVRPLVGAALPAGVSNPALTARQDWAIAPNPAREEIRVLVPGEPQSLQYQVTDIQGRALLSGKIKNKQALSIRSLSPGIYFVRLFSGTQRWATKKLVKQ
jgi:hypothetical protein